MPDDIPFYKTPMGREFFDRSMPSLVKELRRLNENLEKLVKQTEVKSLVEEIKDAKLDAPG